MAKREMRLTDVQKLLRRETAKLGGQAAYAEAHGLTKQYVSQVLRGLRPPSRRLCEALCIREAGMRWVKE